MAKDKVSKRVVSKRVATKRPRVVVTSKVIDRAQAVVDKAEAALAKTTVRWADTKAKIAQAVARAKQSKRPAAKLAAAKTRSLAAQLNHAKRAAAAQLRDAKMTLKDTIKEETTRLLAMQRHELLEKRRMEAKARAMTAFEKRWDKGWVNGKAKMARGRARHTLNTRQAAGRVIPATT